MKRKVTTPTTLGRATRSSGRVTRALGVLNSLPLANPASTSLTLAPSARAPLCQPLGESHGESHGEPLLRLGELLSAVVVRRPSARNRSPYVGDVQLADGRIAIAHMPSLDMGGKCVAGAEVLLKRALTKAGTPVGDGELGKYGTPKCEFILQLVRVAEAENAQLGGAWVGAHPSLGERLALALLEGGRVPGVRPCVELRREVTAVAGTDMRADFVLSHAGGDRSVIEVKTVVDTDYDPARRDTVHDPAPGEARGRKKGAAGCVFWARKEPYARAAIFPWGSSRQSGPEGEKVVSARAIKHVRELTAIASGEKQEDGEGALRAAVLFIVTRDDVESFRPNEEACPSFAKYVREAAAAGVTLAAHRIRWSGQGEAFDAGPLTIDLEPLSDN